MILQINCSKIECHIFTQRSPFFSLKIAPDFATVNCSEAVFVTAAFTAQECFNLLSGLDSFLFS